MNRSDAQRRSAQRAISLAARIALAEGATTNEAFVSELSRQLGMHPQAWRSLFGEVEDVLDAVNEILVEECADRLWSGARAFTPAPDGDPLVQVSQAMANVLPIDRAAIAIRADRRLRALRTLNHGDAVAAAERRFVTAAMGALGEYLSRIERQFTWPEVLAMRVVFDTYERSLEAWILGGGSATDFAESPYVTRTLPSLLERMSELVVAAGR